MEHINGFIKDSIKQVLQNELEAIQFQSDAERVAFCNNDQLKRAIASSQYISDTLKKYPQIIPKLLLAFDSPDVFHPFQLSMALDVSLDIIKQELRKYRCMSLAYIGVLDIAGVYSVTKTISELSEVADKCIKYAASWAMKNSATQIGTAYDNDGCAQKIIIIALGKLGGRELNFSSDVDLCFAYPPTEHFVAKNTRASVEDAYLCIARTIVDLLADNNEYSFVYRVDLKLRPFGDSGPIVMDVNDMEDYYQRYGRDWERYALIKARPIYGDINECRNLMAKFRPFVYRRYMDFGVFESLREMKTLIESEINRKDKHDDIKIGRGGIRQIEFIAQSFQLVRGGKDPIFQQRSLLKALEIIKKYKYISREEYDWLLDSYLFLRKTENALQMLHEQQTHTLPDLELDKNRLCIALNFVSWNDFVDVLNNHRDLVSNLFNKIVAPPIKVIEALPNRIRIGDIWAIIEDKDKCIKELKKCVPTDYELIYKELLSFRSRIDNKQFGYRTRKRLKNLIPEVINISIRSQDPVQALNRLISLVESIGRRSLYISLMLENPNVLQLIIDLCTKSEWVHAQLCKFPILLDELLDYRRNRDISIGNLHNELKLRLQWVDSDDLEHQME
ncbi:MAG: bifunctional [glutamate--ammonia ligase]-adenylyl-L-tyrosine phosphorylase/[glutamate--ammonia-ligase] adenylyltransferase, partial [Francisellaceae bacterium]|nr:bifunctional [glutamate--ammonia ligase]-adenylyl-L-tyrosine phosphorylase/[glutamate--ammonia-ligase] adenylyltransferase [Francisellaceae bacterium]